MARSFPRQYPRTNSTSSAYTIGIEEEYFISKIDSRDTCQKMPPAMAAAFRDSRGPFERELLQSQIEAVTPPCDNLAEARTLIASYRATLGAMGAEHGYAIVAAGTHPKALWSRQRATDAARYRNVMRDLQMLGQRNMVCGLHVHVSIPNPDKRIALMARITPFLPLLLALSTSSPFWHGRQTGLMGYRLASYDELPRTGLPDLFVSAADYNHYIDTMVAARAIKDASYVWWAVRPSLNYPTLELRIADSCTRVEDAIAIAALYRCLVRKLDRDENFNANLGAASRAIALENKWRAQRYGIRGSFVDERRRQALSVKETLDDLIELIGEDAEELGCLSEALSARAILRRGASANCQVAIFEAERKNGATRSDALNAVVDWLVATTAENVTSADRGDKAEPRRNYVRDTPAGGEQACL
jgi:glutamate---cysteine ligase / carboxylate-amine ligase